MPELPRQGPVRRRLRGLQHRQYAHAISSIRTRRSPGAKPVLKTSEHFFFRLSDPKCVEFLTQLAGVRRAGCSRRSPTRRANGSTGKGEQALADWDISRDAPYFGIPIPDAPGKYFYVWLDAPIGYLAALKSYFALGKARANGEPRSFEQFLAAPDTEQIHFIGKDIIYFHTLFWPAMLRFAGPPYKVPDHVYVHGFITVSGEKMSKSRGTGISPLRYLDIGMNAEWLRYYIAAKLNAQRRGPRLQPRRLRRARQQRSDRQVRQHRQPRGQLHHRVTFAGELSYSADMATLMRGGARGRGCGADAATRSASSAQAHARVHGVRRLDQPILRRQPALGPRQGPRQGRAAAGCLLARAVRLQGPVRAAGAGAAAGQPRASRGSCSAWSGPSTGTMQPCCPSESTPTSIS